MHSSIMVAAIVGVSTLASVIYLVNAFAARSTRRKYAGFIMLACPLVGPVFFLGAFVTDRLIGSRFKLEMGDIGFSKGRRGRVLAPDYDKEIQTVPLEETFLISQADEKRKLLLGELKKEKIESYVTLMKALEDDDPETSHYAATAIVSAKEDFENSLRDFDGLYNRAGGASDMELVRQYSDHLLNFLKSGILSDVERRKYSNTLLYVLTSVPDPVGFLAPDDYATIVDQAISLNDYDTASDWAQRALDTHRTESTYLLNMKLYYHTSQIDKLVEVMDALRASQLPLSSEGLDTIRFFMRGRGTNS